jgi:hypothetical protein
MKQLCVPDPKGHRMRFAITATDRYFGVLEAFISSGWQPLKVFTSGLDDQKVLANYAVTTFENDL